VGDFTQLLHVCIAALFLVGPGAPTPLVWSSARRARLRRRRRPCGKKAPRCCKAARRRVPAGDHNPSETQPNLSEQASTMSRSDETRFTTLARLRSLRHPPHHEVRVGACAQSRDGCFCPLFLVGPGAPTPLVWSSARCARLRRRRRPFLQTSPPMLRSSEAPRPRRRPQPQRNPTKPQRTSQHDVAQRRDAENRRRPCGRRRIFRRKVGVRRRDSLAPTRGALPL